MFNSHQSVKGNKTKQRTVGISRRLSLELYEIDRLFFQIAFRTMCERRLEMLLSTPPPCALVRLSLFYTFIISFYLFYSPYILSSQVTNASFSLQLYYLAKP